MRRVLRIIGWNAAELAWTFVYSIIMSMYHDHIIELRTFPPTGGSIVAGIVIFGSILVHDWAIKHKP